MDKFARLHELCRKEEVRQQKAIGCGIAAFGIGAQIFADNIFFALVSLLIVGLGVLAILNDDLWEEDV